MKKLLILFPLLVTIALGQPASVTPTNQTLMVNGTTGAIAAPVSSATFISANGLITASTVNGYFADPSTNGSFSASAWRTDLSVLTAAEIAAAYQPLDSDLTAIAALTTTSYGRSFLDRADAAAARTLMGVVIGTDVQAYDADLSAFGNLATTGLVARTGSGTVATRTLTAPAAGITVSNADGVAGNPTLALANDLAGLEGLAANGLATRTATDTWTNRTIAGTSPISVSNGDGVAGNPTISIGAATTSAAGVVELATTAESLAGTDTGRAPSVNSQEARVLNGDTPRVTAATIISDGATSNRRLEATPGLSGAIAGMPATFWVKRFFVPTSNPSTIAYVIYCGPSTPASFTNALYLVLHTNGALYVEQDGAVGTDYRSRTYGGFRAAYSGQWVQLVVAFTSGDSTTSPTIFCNGVDITSLFSATTGGTPPNWMPTTLNTTKFVLGHNWPAGDVPEVEYGPGAWTAAEALAAAQTGLAPTWWRVATGSAVGKYISDFSSGVDSWVANDASEAVTAVDADADGAGIPPTNDWLKLASVSSGVLTPYRNSGVLSGARRFIVTGDLFVPSSATTIASNRIKLISVATASLATQGLVTPVAGSVVSFQTTLDITNDGRPAINVTDASGNTVTIPAGEAFYVKNLKYYPAGPLAKWEIQPVDSSLSGVIARDAGANNIALVGVPGVTPITTSNRGVISATLTWSGTHEAKSIIGQAALPSNARVDYITSKATVASSGSGMTVGSVTTPALLVAANTYTTAKKDHTLAARMPAGTASNDLNLVVDPDTANYTGSITVTIGYTTTISTP